MRRTASVIVTFIVIALTMPLMAASLREIAKYLGLRAVVVPVVGTGSMYPSLYWDVAEGGPDDSQKMSVQEYRTTPHMFHRFAGFTFQGKTYLRRSISFGDMVTFQSDATKAILSHEGKDTSSGFIKRVIGLPGDEIELRDGYVMRNGEKIEEPYIYRPRSTYGISFLEDCRKLKVPAGKYLVLGDNRKNSSDSRGELGLVDDADISFILPYGDQQIYHSLWRDTSRDAELSNTPTLSAEEFYALLNSERKKKGVKPLVESKLLTKSAGIRGEQYLRDGKGSLKESLAKAGYSNILTGEFMSNGHFTAEELLQNLLFFSNTASQVLNGEYQELGVAAVNRDVDGCPAQVIIGQLGGYLPPDYDKETVQSWNSLVSNLEEVIPSWEKAVGWDGIDQDKLADLLKLLRRRLDLAREITSAMRDNKWLTRDQENRIESDKADADRAEALIKDLNGQ